jgi:hypothetical protein
VEKIIKILPIPETMQGISTSAESKEERKKKKKTLYSIKESILQANFFPSEEKILTTDCVLICKV